MASHCCEISGREPLSQFPVAKPSPLAGLLGALGQVSGTAGHPPQGPEDGRWLVRNVGSWIQQSINWATNNRVRVVVPKLTNII